ncbi:hypothetical protein SDC9_138039 [bioreactor metagenome]|uniref:Uncharacterized protein n=1 Tax=bioreactor metagenome TaxID=1076179 RepID=A0A645DNP4_9ZZZZ
MRPAHWQLRFKGGIQGDDAADTATTGHAGRHTGQGTCKGDENTGDVRRNLWGDPHGAGDQRLRPVGDQLWAGGAETRVCAAGRNYRRRRDGKTTVFG